ncbi:helix-turn-helix domain-containing protein [Rosistilla oblonga]|uniref:helix-turn-helix domain-containing protein n=1 Tax=Rosistilla oblonga TaxID=2527990 RepID=UPI003A985DBF
MIRNEQEYREASERIEAERNRLDAHRKSLSESGLGDTELARAMEPLVSFHEQLREEVAHYENLKRGVFPDLENLRGLGVLLVSLRIARGITQRELAAKLDVHESQVSRDERNEYHGVTLDRANRILDALDVRLQTTVVEAPLGRETTDA